MTNKFNLIIKLLAIALIIYVFAQQKNDYWAAMGNQKTEAITPAVKK